MEALVFKPTEFTPEIILDHINNRFEMSGFSRPEDVRSFYNPILKWLSDLGDLIDAGKAPHSYTKNPMTFVFKLNYFNSASAKFLLDVLMQVNKLYAKGVLVEVEWYYEDGDDEILESGEELDEMVDFEFHFIPVEVD